MTLHEPDDDELLAWRADWQAEAGPSPEALAAIRRRVRCQSRGMALLLAGELLLAAAALAFLVRFAIQHPDPVDVATMAGLCLLTLWATACSLWLRRGLWKPEAETIAAFLDLSVDRSRRRLRSLRAAWWLLGGETVLFIPWIGYSVRLGSYPAAYGFLLILVATTAAILIGIGRWTRRELRRLEEMRDGLKEDQ
ncbi:MAG: hypothetical protein WAM82_16440 [Thermoanaerobaculia bacterium]